MPEEDLHLPDQARLHAHDARDKPGHDREGGLSVSTLSLAPRSHSIV